MPPALLPLVAAAALLLCAVQSDGLFANVATRGSRPAGCFYEWTTQPCPWHSTTGVPNQLYCADGTSCNVCSDGDGCCALRGGRAQCPLDRTCPEYNPQVGPPMYMCASPNSDPPTYYPNGTLIPDNGDDYICNSSCADYGGVRGCVDTGAG
eukprot:gene48934-15772_t